VTEWLDLMLEEVTRKQREAKEAAEEAARRKKKEGSKTPRGDSNQSK